MNILTEFDEYFQAQGVNPGIKVFKDSFDQKDKEATCIYEYVGTQGVPQVSGVNRNFQFVARSTKVKTAKEMAIAMYKALQTPDGILQLNAKRWMTIQTKQPPFKIKVDDQGLVYYGFNVSTITYFE